MRERSEAARRCMVGATSASTAVLDFVAFAAKPMPLVSLLDEAPRRIAAIFDADVCSLYLVEGDGHELVMRGNVGFSSEALGQVRLAIGEGMTGEAVEYLRPVTSDNARAPPVLQALRTTSARSASPSSSPSRSAARPGRSARSSSSAAQRGLRGARHRAPRRARRDHRGRHPPRRAHRRSATGAPVAAQGRRRHAQGDAHGAALRRRAARSARSPRSGGPGAAARAARRHADVTRGAQAAPRRVRRRRQGDARALRARAHACDSATDAGFLATYVDILGDARFRERADELVADGGERDRVRARTASRVRSRARPRRSRAMRSSRSARATSRTSATRSSCWLPPTSAPSFPPRRSSSATGSPSSIFSSRRARTRWASPSPSAPAGRARGRSCASSRCRRSSGCEGLFKWASDGDVALLDADHGLLVINPSKSEVAAMREDTGPRSDERARRRSVRQRTSAH